MASWVTSTKHVKKYLIPILLKVSQKLKRKECSNAIYVKIVNKTFANRVHQYIKRSICHDQGDLSQGLGMVQQLQINQCDNYINKMKDKNYMISIDAKKAFDKIQHNL